MEAESVRLFFALFPPAPVRQALSEWQTTLQPLCGGRPTATGDLHLTLAFLGDVKPAQWPNIQTAGNSVEGIGFDLRIDRVESWRHNRIVWAGASSQPQALTALVDALRTALQSAGLHFDAKPFVPHITLFRNARHDANLPALPAIDWRVQDFVLMKAARRAATRYEVAARWSL